MAAPRRTRRRRDAIRGAMWCAATPFAVAYSSFRDADSCAVWLLQDIHSSGSGSGSDFQHSIRSDPSRSPAPSARTPSDWASSVQAPTAAASPLSPAEDGFQQLLHKTKQDLDELKQRLQMAKMQHVPTPSPAVRKVRRGMKGFRCALR